MKKKEREENYYFLVCVLFLSSFFLLSFFFLSFYIFLFFFCRLNALVESQDTMSETRNVPGPTEPIMIRYPSGPSPFPYPSLTSGAFLPNTHCSSPHFLAMCPGGGIVSLWLDFSVSLLLQHPMLLPHPSATDFITVRHIPKHLLRFSAWIARITP